MGKHIAFSINDAAKATGLSKYLIIEAVKNGEIVGGSDGRRLTVEVGSLQRWLVNQGTQLPALAQLLSVRDRALQEASELDDGPRPALIDQAG